MLGRYGRASPSHDDRLRSFGSRCSWLCGQGPAAAMSLRTVLRGGFKQTTALLSGDPSWCQVFPGNHIMGQPARSLNQLSDTDRSQLSSMPGFVSTAQKDISDAYVSSVFQSDSEQLVLVESPLVRADRSGSGWYLSCLDETVVEAEQVVFCGGAGPERQLQDSGVVLLNHPTSRRAAQKEVTTALQSLEIPDFFKGKRVLLYGGGATGAWLAEIIIQGGCRELRWGSVNGFANADPTGVNAEIMRLTQSSRYVTELKSLKYLGDLDQVPDEREGLEITEFVTSSSKMSTESIDIVVCATGQNPYARTGVFNVFSIQMINRLKPVVMNNGGVIGYTPGLIVAGPSVADGHVPRRYREQYLPPPGETKPHHGWLRGFGHGGESCRRKSPRNKSRLTRSCTSVEATISYPLSTRNVSMAACPIRLLPSTNGWFMTSEKPKAAAFSTAVGYRFTPPKVMRGWATAESRALGCQPRASAGLGDDQPVQHQYLLDCQIAHRATPAAGRVLGSSAGRTPQLPQNPDRGVSATPRRRHSVTARGRSRPLEPARVADGPAPLAERS